MPAYDNAVYKIVNENVIMCFIYWKMWLLFIVHIEILPEGGVEEEYGKLESPT